jgi:hypothetical protein
MLLYAALVGCRPDPVETDPGACHPPEIDWGDPVTTLTERVIVDPPLDTPTELNPSLPEGLAAARDAGLGTWSVGAGEPWTMRDDLAPGHGGSGTGRRSLMMFLHQSDAQLADVESPTRMVGADAIGETQSAARPEELYEAHGLDALIRTANGLSQRAPIDFSLATGDNADSTQENELRWFTAIFDGVPVKIDSGDPDSQVDEDCNDPVAEFTPLGTDFPWYAVAGNHDVLVQGNFAPTLWSDNALGSDAPLGTRDLSEPGGPMAYWTVADAARKLMDRSDIAAVMMDGPATPGPVGHGFSTDNITADTVNWVAHPVPGVPVRLIAVDANPTGSADGMLTAAERDSFLVPALDAAQEAGDLVILTSHYALGTTPMEGGGVVGDLLQTYPNVVLVVAGHWHRNVIRSYGSADDPAGFWEIVGASSIDWPPQGRLIELVDNGDGTLSIVTTVFDVPAPEGSMAARFRELSIIDFQSGWRLSDGSGDAQDRNAELVQALPVGWTGGFGTEGVRSDAL